jgi:drug/metabolite transporter superfamily protein YnfA
MTKLIKNGYFRSWELWLAAAFLAAVIFIFFPVKFASLVLLLARFFALAGGIYVCTRVFFKDRLHDLPPNSRTRQFRTLGVYLALAGAAVGAGSGAIG